MGNLEKAGVLVVVALLAVILVVAFLNFPDTGKAPVLGANASKLAQAPDVKKAGPPKPEPSNIYLRDPQSDLIKPRADGDRLATDPPPRAPEGPIGTGLVNMPPTDETARVSPPILPKTEAAPHEEKKPSAPPAAAPAWPKHVKVQQGESLWTIAVREYGSKLGPRMVGAITDANPKVRPEAMKAGTELALPAPPEEPAVSTKPPADAQPKGTPTDAKGKAGAPKSTPATSKPSRKLPFTPE